MRIAFFMLALSGFPFVGDSQDFDSAKTAKVTLRVVSSFGEPVRSYTVHIDGNSIFETVNIKDSTVITLAFGDYRFRSEATARYWGSERIVHVVAPTMLVVFGVSPKEAFAVFGEGTREPYTLSGTIDGAVEMGKLTARLTGVFLSDIVEADVNAKHGFDFAVLLQGEYELEVLSGKSVIARRNITLNELTGRPLKVRVTLP